MPCRAFSLFLFLTYLRRVRGFFFGGVFKVMVVDHKPLRLAYTLYTATLLSVIHFIRCVVWLAFLIMLLPLLAFVSVGGMVFSFAMVSLSPLRSNNKYCYRKRADGDDDDGGYNEMRPLLLLAFLFHLVHSF